MKKDLTSLVWSHDWTTDLQGAFPMWILLWSYECLWFGIQRRQLLTLPWQQTGFLLVLQLPAKRIVNASLREMLTNPPRFIASDSLELCFQPNERINRLSQLHSSFLLLFQFFIFFKIVKRKLHTILQKEDNYILPLGETTKWLQQMLPVPVGGSQAAAGASCMWLSTDNPVLQSVFLHHLLCGLPK